MLLLRHIGSLAFVHTLVFVMAGGHIFGPVHSKPLFLKSVRVLWNSLNCISKIDPGIPASGKIQGTKFFSGKSGNVVEGKGKSGNLALIEVN